MRLCLRDTFIIIYHYIYHINTRPINLIKCFSLDGGFLFAYINTLCTARFLTKIFPYLIGTLFVHTIRIDLPKWVHGCIYKACMAFLLVIWSWQSAILAISYDDLVTQPGVHDSYALITKIKNCRKYDTIVCIFCINVSMFIMLVKVLFPWLKLTERWEMWK